MPRSACHRACDRSPFPSSLICLAWGCVAATSPGSGRPHSHSIFGDRAPDRHLPSSIQPWSTAVSETVEEKAERLCTEMESDGGCQWKHYRPVIARGGATQRSCQPDRRAAPHGLPDEPHLQRPSPSMVEVLDWAALTTTEARLQPLDGGRAGRGPTLRRSLHLVVSKQWSQQLPAWAAACPSSPHVLLLDEATSNSHPLSSTAERGRERERETRGQRWWGREGG